MWAAFFDFAAAFVFGTGVAKTVGAGLVHSEFVDIYVVAGGLVGAIVWNIATWLLALPTSSSHALVSGIAGRPSPRADSASSSARAGSHCCFSSSSRR